MPVIITGRDNLELDKNRKWYGTLTVTVTAVRLRDYAFDVFAGADTIEEVTVKALKEADKILWELRAALVAERNRLVPSEQDQPFTIPPTPNVK